MGLDKVADNTDDSVIKFPEELLRLNWASPVWLVTGLQLGRDAIVFS